MSADHSSERAGLRPAVVTTPAGAETGSARQPGGPVDPLRDALERIVVNLAGENDDGNIFPWAALRIARDALAAEPPAVEYVYRATNGAIRWYHRTTLAAARADLGEVGDGPYVERRVTAGEWERVA